MTLNRRLALWSLLAAALLGACAAPTPTPPASSTHPPIVFVHGNGDTAALWYPTMWRFESNGWPRERLHAIDVPYPVARDDDGKPQEGRTSTTEHMHYLAAEVDKVRKAAGADRVVLYGCRAAAMRSATTSPTAAARARCRTRSSAARRTTACGRTRSFAPATSSTGPARS